MAAAATAADLMATVMAASYGDGDGGSCTAVCEGGYMAAAMVVSTDSGADEAHASVTDQRRMLPSNGLQ